VSTTVYAVYDQHGMNTQAFFANVEDAQAYAERCRKPPAPNWQPGSYIIVPTVVWDSLSERDEAPE
jgi:hypothetical protein